MKVIGLTGGIGTGKSTVSKIILDLGLPVLDADVFAREVVESGSFGLKALVQVFGNEILQSKGELDRSKLGQKLFSDPGCRRVVENILHPLIQWRAKQEIERLRCEGKKIVFYDAALIFEKDLVKNFDFVVVVHTPEEEQIKRVMARDKLTLEQIKERINSQIPMAHKISKAHFLIDNSGSQAQTQEQVRAFLRVLNLPI